MGGLSAGQCQRRGIQCFGEWNFPPLQSRLGLTEALEMYGKAQGYLWDKGP